MTKDQVRSTEEALSLEQTLRLALEALESNRRTHHYCEDTWYSCPKHEDGCANDSEGDERNCGADKANAGIDQAITAIKEALAQPEQESVMILPDGSAFGVMSFRLPDDHWIYAPNEYRDGEYEPIDLPKPILTHQLRDAVVAAVRYAVRGATMRGQETDFDPDALVQNAVYALCGPYTTPPQRKPLTDEEIKAIEDGIWKPEFFDDTERQANCEFARAIEAAHGIKEEV